MVGINVAMSLNLFIVTINDIIKNAIIYRNTLKQADASI